MRKVLLLLSQILIIGIASAQNYTSNAVNASGWFSDKGIGVFSVMSGTSGFDLQTTIRSGNNLNFLLNGSVLSHQRNRHLFLEAGVGFSQKLDINGTSSVGVYIGAGRGKTKSYQGTSSLLGSPIKQGFNGAFTRYFLQPEATFRQRGLELTIAARTVYLTYADPEFQSNEVPVDHHRCWLYEPSFTLKINGRKGFLGDKQLIFQLGLIMGDEQIIQDPFKFSMGFAWKPERSFSRKRINAADFF